MYRYTLSKVCYNSILNFFINKKLENHRNSLVAPLQHTPESKRLQKL